LFSIPVNKGLSASTDTKNDTKNEATITGAYLVIIKTTTTVINTIAAIVNIV
jgi:hypothetical protein